MLHGARIARPHDRQLRQLAEGARRDSAVEALWSSSNGEIMEHYDGPVLRMILPGPNGQGAELGTHVFKSVDFRAARVAVFTRRATEGPQAGVPATDFGGKP